MATLRRYRNIANPVVASFDGQELATGLGIAVYYGATTTDSSGTNYILSDFLIYSSSIETRRTTGPATTTMNFDTSAFNVPRTVRGTARVTFGVEVSTTSHWTVTLQKWDGITATNISSAVVSADLIGTNTESIVTMDLPLTLTRIKKGEKLRLAVDMYLSANDVNGTTMGHDPINRDGTEIIPSVNPSLARTQLTLYCPFVIEP